MSCPLCGEVCRCSTSALQRGGGSVLCDPPDNDSSLVDPEAYESSEEQFAASLGGGVAASATHETTLTGIERVAHEIGGRAYGSGGIETGPTGAWRSEVASRVDSYRARRRKRFDPDASLHLAFEPPTDSSAEREPERKAAIQRVASRFAGNACEAAQPETNIIEFPKPEPPRPEPAWQGSLLPPSDELAEPITDLRILDAPEEELAPIMPQVAAITLENDGEMESEGVLSDLDLSLRVAPMGKRIFAALTDAVLVATATAAFGIVFLQISRTVPQSRLVTAIAIAVAGVLWAMYQCIFLIEAGTTPGMQLARLGICGFQGEELDRRTRRARAVAVIVSGLPVGLGFAWALLDEDALCWHDRMSRTCVVEI
jgi:uncharacterized RDD family membrane protein YckC